MIVHCALGLLNYSHNDPLCMRLISCVKGPLWIMFMNCGKDGSLCISLIEWAYDGPLCISLMDCSDDIESNVIKYHEYGETISSQ